MMLVVPRAVASAVRAPRDVVQADVRARAAARGGAALVAGEHLRERPGGTDVVMRARGSASIALRIDVRSTIASCRRRAATVWYAAHCSSRPDRDVRRPRRSRGSRRVRERALPSCPHPIAHARDVRSSHVGVRLDALLVAPRFVGVCLLTDDLYTDESHTDERPTGEPRSVRLVRRGSSMRRSSMRSSSVCGSSACTSSVCGSSMRAPRCAARVSARRQCQVIGVTSVCAVNAIVPGWFCSMPQK